MTSSKQRTFRVTVKRLCEYSATVEIRASSQAEADAAALKAYYAWDGHAEFPPLWHVNEPIDHDAKIDTRFRCVDCDFDTQGSEYYKLANLVCPGWPHGFAHKPNRADLTIES